MSDATSDGKKTATSIKYPNSKHRIPLKEGERAASTRDFTVLMDYFRFDNDVAFNYFVTETDVTTTLVLSDQEQGSCSILCSTVVSIVWFRP